MNANELADIVDKWAYKESAEYLTDAATMLRQQADRIRNLEKTLGFKNSGYETINLTPPVAWINLDRFNDEALYLADCVSENKVDNMGITTPLYTHPTKELDEQFKKGFEAGKEEGWKAHKFHHPVKEQDTDCQYCKQGCIRCDARKQLTDEEMISIYEKDWSGIKCGLGRAVEQAILRKASEK